MCSLSVFQPRHYYFVVCKDIIPPSVTSCLRTFASAPHLAFLGKCSYQILGFILFTYHNSIICGCFLYACECVLFVVLFCYF